MRPCLDHIIALKDRIVGFARRSFCCHNRDDEHDDEEANDACGHELQSLADEVENECAECRTENAEAELAIARPHDTV